MEDCIHETIIDSLGFSLSGQHYSKLHNTLSGRTKAYKIFSADETIWIQESRSSRQLEKITCWGPYKLFILERSFRRCKKWKPNRYAVILCSLSVSRHFRWNVILAGYIRRFLN